MADKKTQWPELVGKTADEAKEAVKADRPDCNVQVLGELSPCTMDYREDRVRIFVKADNTVATQPQTG